MKLNPCLFCKRDSMIIQEDELSEGFVFESFCTKCGYRTPSYCNVNHMIEAHNAISDLKAHAVEVLAKELRLSAEDVGYVEDESFYVNEARALLGWEE